AAPAAEPAGGAGRNRPRRTAPQERRPAGAAVSRGRPQGPAPSTGRVVPRGRAPCGSGRGPAGRPGTLGRPAEAGEGAVPGGTGAAARTERAVYGTRWFVSRHVRTGCLMFHGPRARTAPKRGRRRVVKTGRRTSAQG